MEITDIYPAASHSIVSQRGFRNAMLHFKIRSLRNPDAGEVLRWNAPPGPSGAGFPFPDE